MPFVITNEQTKINQEKGMFPVIKLTLTTKDHWSVYDALEFDTQEAATAHLAKLDLEAKVYDDDTAGIRNIIRIEET